MRLRLALVVATLTLAVASGCTTTSAGSPFPGSSVKTSTSGDTGSDGDLPTDGAPEVADPLDVSRFEQNPCEALTAEQTRTLNIPATGEPLDDAVGKGCAWENTETHGAANIRFSSEDERGLSSVYREARGSAWAYFEQIGDIEGHPAVAFDPDTKEPRDDCTVAVGVSDQLVFGVRVDLSDDNIDKKNPCDVTAQVASMMMRTMLGGE
ncbi:DUF3558 domain-containing protein [Actinophytocola oryzae]|uniref:Uncharacterized protein DUF3558 n=1 Tax=Actinophytocola oryzae TaxID=502181 RepID=A0A4R7VN06_9PSEU|nr:DUF3558 domain-containing protein [Actinophytocola oryzae]TDV50715.1 uncharacterized protein DUF3558 [Actinophytocola oryzae]